MPFRISWAKSRFFAEFYGEVTAAEIEAVNEEFAGDSRFDSVRYSIWDMSRIATLTMPDADIEYAAAMDLGASAIRPELRGAIIVRAGSVKEVIDKYMALMSQLDTGWDTRLFDNLEAAEHWLEGG